ncbi:hypothetical protein T265_14697, partial [Opisthorchis viverrini]
CCVHAPASNAQLPTLPLWIIGEQTCGSYNHCTISTRLLKLDNDMMPILQKESAACCVHAPASNAQLPTLPLWIIGEQTCGSYNHCTISTRLLKLTMMMMTILQKESAAVSHSLQYQAFLVIPFPTIDVTHLGVPSRKMAVTSAAELAGNGFHTSLPSH